MSDSEPTPPPPPPPPPAENRPGEPELFRGLLGGGGEDNELPAPRGRKRSYKEQRSEMGFFEHLEELRMTIIKCAFAAAAGMGLVGVFFIPLFKFFRYPLDIALGDGTPILLRGPLEPMGAPTMVFSVSIYGGIILALPVMAYFVARFIAPGLTMREKGMLRPGLVAAVALFFTGAITCFMVMLPAGLRFSRMLEIKLGFENNWTANYYYSLVVWATLATGLVFEFPLILIILQVLGVLSPDTLRSGRRYAILVIAVIGGLLAPSPDPGSLLMMATPMYLLYEASIVIGAALRKRRMAAIAREAMTSGG